MIHGFFLILLLLHIFGMVGIIGIGTFLLVKSEISEETKKKLAMFFMSSAHTQLLTGFVLFSMVFNEINHTKIGVKIILAIFIAITATMYRKKIRIRERPNPMLLLTSVSTAIIVTAIAFIW
jgi:hypothetical protein